MSDTIYFLSNYDWEKATIIGEGPKRYKVRLANGYEQYVLKDNCATPFEEVCIVWETWQGRNGQGGYRVERHLYPDDRVCADKVSRQHVGEFGRVTEQAFGTKQQAAA